MLPQISDQFIALTAPAVPPTTAPTGPATAAPPTPPVAARSVTVLPQAESVSTAAVSPKAIYRMIDPIKNKCLFSPTE
jgi:hypothetical protein